MIVLNLNFIALGVDSAYEICMFSGDVEFEPDPPAELQAILGVNSRPAAVLRMGYTASGDG